MTVQIKAHFLLLFLLVLLLKLSNLLVLGSVVVKTVRLQPGEDLKKSLLQFVCRENFRAASVIASVGSLQSLHIRLATDISTGDMGFVKVKNETFEITALSGTMECHDNDGGYGHLHINVANKQGSVIGGHLMLENYVFTTAEITVLENKEYIFTRQFDPQSGYDELKVETVSSTKISLLNQFKVIIYNISVKFRILADLFRFK